MVPAKLCRADSIPSLQLVFFARLVSLSQACTVALTSAPQLNCQQQLSSSRRHSRKRTCTYSSFTECLSFLTATAGRKCDVMTLRLGPIFSAQFLHATLDCCDHGCYECVHLADGPVSLWELAWSMQTWLPGVSLLHCSIK